MPRYALRIEYDGRPFAGWQRQAAHPSVQGALEAALAPDRAGGAAVAGAGRTDAGVHAWGQVAHVDLARGSGAVPAGGGAERASQAGAGGGGGGGEVADGFHARFDAIERTICSAWWSGGRRWCTTAASPGGSGSALDAEAMRQGAAALVGRHDFTTFRSSTCQAKSAGADARRDGDRGDRRHRRGANTASGFGRGRSCTTRCAASSARSSGSGAGAWPAERVGTALAARDRAACGPVCPPDGLYLVAVRYPADLFAGQRPEATVTRG